MTIPKIMPIMKKPRLCSLCGQPGHRKDHCPTDPLAEPGAVGGPKHVTNGPMRMRELTQQEKNIVFSGIQLRYLNTIREMEGGTTYGIPVHGEVVDELVKGLDKAAELLGLKLRWANYSSVSSEVYCELIV